MASSKEIKHLNFYYHYICHSCKEICNDLKKCSGCGLLSYCSVQHQRYDWKKHRDLCKSIQRLLSEWRVPSIFGVEAKTVEEWRHIRLSLISHVEKQLSRPLSIDEKQMFYFPKVCKVCFSTKVNCDFKCEQCGVVEYCCKEHYDIHMSVHLSECNTLKKCYFIDKLCSELIVNPQPTRKIFEYPFIDHKTFPSDTMSFINNLFHFNGGNHSILSEPMSGILSIVFSIFSCKRLQFSSKDSLEIHIIGASDYEYNLIQYTEIIFHCFSSLKKLSIYLIGPECLNHVDGAMANICDTCKNKHLQIRSKKSLYHPFILTKGYKKPDIVVAFNCGFNEFSGTNKDTWKETLSKILQLKNIIFIFTSYTKIESEEDYNIVKELTKENENNIFNTACYNNPYRSYRPYRDWEASDEEVFYFNNYITIVES